MHNRDYFQASDQGFTLTELLVAIAISGVVLAAVTKLFISSNQFYTVQSQVANVQQDIRAAMSVMARDIRMAGYDDPEFDDDSGIAIATEDTLEFSYDNATGNRTRYGYQFDAAEKRLEYYFPNTGAGNYQGFTNQDTITDMEFEYNVDGGGWTNSPANPEDIRQVRVNMCGQISGSYSETFDNTYCFNNTITCRNMGL